jgi:putative phosphoribosyl transferase
MMFVDREEAGRQLVQRLKSYRGAKDTIILALPRGGVVTGCIVARALGLPIDVLVTRKIGAPGNEEYAIGAISETGVCVWNEKERSQTDQAYLEATVAREKLEAQRRLEVYRRGFPPRKLKGKTVLLVDDGIATGLTMRAAIATVRAEKAKRVIVAVPVAPAEILADIANEVDDLVALQTPAGFLSVGQNYRYFQQVEDQTVIDLLQIP